MATYAIGDIQGCYYTFLNLLDEIHFSSEDDTLWLVGDLINRGAGSLPVLEWCYQHQAHIKVVLGNHDLHAIAVAHGIKRPHPSDTLEALLASKDAHMLLNWLRMQPLMVEGEYAVMVHAGLYPQWTLAQAKQCANEVEQVLRGDSYLAFLQHMYGNEPNQWQDGLQGVERLRAITNAFTRMRVCDAQGVMEFGFKGELADLPSGYYPWFKAPHRQSQDRAIIFGHWSALGLYRSDNVIALDTGCLWGRTLTAYCLESETVKQVPLDGRDVSVKNGRAKD